jgi:hypothetical protein
MWVVALCLGATIVLGAVLLAGPADSPRALDKPRGEYTAASVRDSCALLDLTALEKWAPATGAPPQHVEQVSDGEGFLSCSAENSAADGSRLATLGLSALIYTTSSGGSLPGPPLPRYSNESAGERGDVAGLGEAAQYFWLPSKSLSIVDWSAKYILGVNDGNLHVEITLDVVGTNNSKAALAEEARAQAQRVIAGLRG